jgi:WD repeat-containing protein 7
LLEAVVKSLDPTLTSERDAVFDAATEILGHVVQRLHYLLVISDSTYSNVALRFPTVDFHAATQRLAVGTGEGAVIMYDVKTATRLYVLDGHKKRASGCSFSPDGRRLVTVSLEESAALVWKVGSSFSSFFYPGAPPRQGNSGSDPFKTFPFNVEFEGGFRLLISTTLTDHIIYS